MTSEPAPVFRSARVLARVAVIAVLAAVAAIGLPLAAAAHNVLLSSDPSDGAVLQAAPSTVQLTFDQPVQNFEPVVTVLGPDGQRYESGSPQVGSTEVSAAVNALPGPGDYVIAYRVVSADGHPVQGEIRFTLAAGASGATTASGTADATGAVTGPSPAPGAATASGAPPTTASVAPAASSSGLSGWVWAAIALAAVLVVAAVVVIVRRPRSEP